MVTSKRLPMTKTKTYRNGLISIGFAVMASIPSVMKAEPIDFERDILPIFNDSCLDCHGPDEQESGFRVDSRVALLKGGDYGEPSIVPGDVAKSLLLKVVSHEDPDLAMPPDDKLSDENIKLLKRWVSEGAVWPGQMDDEIVQEESDHWSFQPVVKPEIPHRSVSVDNPVDAFLLEKLAKKDMNFSPPADPRTLIRRASIVLTGIAPSPKETQEFVESFRQDANTAYADLVERLLASQHFGERWAQHWLDVIRWAETNGSEANLYRKNAWIYRDYVVRAFNQDKPYDQFVQEQIAGDSLGTGEATGFLVAGPHVPAATVGREPTAIRQARADRMDEIMQTVGASVMGVTIGCARCHNHKFDPITIKDYYAMTGVFQDVEFGSRFPEFSADHPRRKSGHAIRTDIAKLRTQLRKMGGWEENWGAFRELHFKATTAKSIRIRFKMKNVGLDELEVFGPESKNENLAHKRRGTIVSGSPQKGFDGRNPVIRVNDGEYGTMAWRAKGEGDLTKAENQPYIQFDFAQSEAINRIRLSSNREYFYDTDYLTKKPFLPRYEYDVDVLREDGAWQPWIGTWATNKKLAKEHPERAALLSNLQHLIERLGEEGPRPSFVGRFVRPAKTFVFSRGSPENPRDEVQPAGPAIFDGDLGLTQTASGAERRAEFAKWITSSKNPLTARVMVNRLWHHVFGSGIVTTTSDFGRAGASPTHPELLDWLAAEFVSPTQPVQRVSETNRDSNDAKPWSIKSMLRLLVLSDAFRQSSLPNEISISKDAGSTLLWRFPPKRVEAEVIRDSILQASGTLDRSIGGRSYRIHNEKATYAQWQVVKNYGPKTWRRMLYQERMRRVDDQMFTAFDFPDCGQVRAKRPVSTTPLQALNLMNSDFVIEQSKRVAERANSDSGGKIRDAVVRCFELLLTRKPQAHELEMCLQLARNNDLPLVARTLINTNEFAFLP